MTQSKRSVLVAGAQGVIGRAVGRTLQFSPRDYGLWAVPTVTGGDDQATVSPHASSVMETHFGRFYRGDAHDKTSRKQSWQPGC